MAVVQFEVCDEIARRVRGLVDSGREGAVTFCVRARVVVEVRTLDIWGNDLVTGPRHGGSLEQHRDPQARGAPLKRR